MQEILDRILGGNFDYENGSLEFSCSKIEISLSQGTAYEGSFHILSASEGYVKGSVISDHLLMESVTIRRMVIDKHTLRLRSKRLTRNRYDNYYHS